MTQNEKLVWASVYAVEYARLLRQSSELDIRFYPPEAIENAWAAVNDLKENLPIVESGWGKDHQVYRMLKEMTE